GPLRPGVCRGRLAARGLESARRPRAGGSVCLRQLPRQRARHHLQAACLGASPVGLQAVRHAPAHRRRQPQPGPDAPARPRRTWKLDTCHAEAGRRRVGPTKDSQPEKQEVNCVAMPRSMWKGVVSFGMVSIPIRLYNATESSEKVKFRQLCPEHNSPISYKRWCPEGDHEVAYSDIKRGYEVGKDRYVIIDDKDLDNLPLP